MEKLLWSVCLLLLPLTISFIVELLDFFFHPGTTFSNSSLGDDTDFCLYFCLGTAFLLWHLFCPHMSGMYHGTTCGSQLYLPPRCPPGLQDSHHSAPGRCSARTTGYSSKILLSTLFSPCFFLPQLVCYRVKCQGKKRSVSAVSLLTPSVLLNLWQKWLWSWKQSAVIWILYSCSIFLSCNSQYIWSSAQTHLSLKAFWRKFWSCIAVPSLVLFLQLLFSAVFHACTASRAVTTCDSGYIFSVATKYKILNSYWISVKLLTCLCKESGAISIQGLFCTHRCML